MVLGLLLGLKLMVIALLKATISLLVVEIITSTTIVTPLVIAGREAVHGKVIKSGHSFCR